MLKEKLTVLFILLSVLIVFGTSVTAAEDVTISWWDWNDSIESWTEETFENYEEENPNVNIEYQLYTISRFNEVISMAVRSGNAADVHGVGTFQPSMALENNWFQPLNPYIDKLYPGGTEAFKDRFSGSAFVEGLNVLNGNIYHIPRSGFVGTIGGALLFYNKDLFRQAGLDPERPPKTWSEFREYAKKITEAGNGEYYGMIMGGNQLNRWSAMIGSLAKTAGKVGYSTPTLLTGFDYQTGKYDYQADSMVKALQLYKDMNNDGSFYPGFLSINAPNARARFGAGEAGFIIQGRWCISTWNQNNPDLDLGVAFLPVPDEGRGGYLVKTPDAAASDWAWALSSQSDNPEEAAKLLLYRYSDENMITYNQTGDGISPIPALNTKDQVNPTIYKVSYLTEENTRLIPMPQAVNPDAGNVLGNMKTMRPSIDEILQGSFMDAIDYINEATKLSEKMNNEMDRAIKELQDDGSSITRDDFTFPDWNPLENYSTK